MTKLDLDRLEPFAQGYNRYCYEHPSDPDRCLKVIRPENIQARYRRQSRLKQCLGAARLNDNHQELTAHRQPAIQALIHAGQDELLWGHIPRFYGTRETSMGMANESELIRCADGHVAPTLEALTREAGLTPELETAIEDFVNWLRNTGILTRNLLPHNLVVSDRSGRPDLFLVDGLGAPVIPQALARLPGWSSHYIERKINRFRVRLAWEQNPEGFSWEDFQRKG